MLADRQSSQRDGRTPPPRADTPLVDMAALGARLRQLRQWKRYSQATLAQRAGVDVMVVSRLERQHKPRLEVETAAKLAQVFTWTLDQFCGLAPVPTIPEPPSPAPPLPPDMPAWLAGGLPTTTEDRQLAAHILAWQVKGAPLDEIATRLAAWGVKPLGARAWSRDQVQFCYGRYTRDTKKGKADLLREYGFVAEARQLMARRVR